MASVMIKVAGEGGITKAHRLADPGPTTGSSVVYEVLNVPEGVDAEAIIELFKKINGEPPHSDYEVDYKALA